LTANAGSTQWQQVFDALTHTTSPTYNNLDYITAQTDFNGY
jgi:hypothetical protein